MLKNIPKIVSPELVKYLRWDMEMSLVIADEISAHRINKKLFTDGHGVPVILDAISQLLLIHTVTIKQALCRLYQEIQRFQLFGMNIKALLGKYHTGASIKEFERFEFYDQAEKAYLVIQTGESVLLWKYYPEKRRFIKIRRCGDSLPSFVIYLVKNQIFENIGNILYN